eukprot:1177513-Prorocentrum_minimum.AAC.4
MKISKFSASRAYNGRQGGVPRANLLGFSSRRKHRAPKSESTCLTLNDKAPLNDAYRTVVYGVYFREGRYRVLFVTSWCGSLS